MAAVLYRSKLPREYLRGQSRGRPLAGSVVTREVRALAAGYVPARDVGEPANHRNDAQTNGPDAATAGDPLRSVPGDLFSCTGSNQPSACEGTSRPGNASQFAYSADHQLDRGPLSAAAQLALGAHHRLSRRDARACRGCYRAPCKVHELQHLLAFVTLDADGHALIKGFAVV